jgi:hypothetical protein
MVGKMREQLSTNMHEKELLMVWKLRNMMIESHLLEELRDLTLHMSV